MSETRKIAAILVSDVVGYSRLAGADEDRILARLRALRSDLIDPTIAVHHGRVVKRTGDGSLVEFRSVVEAVRCAIEVQNCMVERNAGLPAERRIDFRIGIHLGDVVEESDGDLMGDGVNIAARLEGICEPGSICLSEQAYWQVKARLDLAVDDRGEVRLKNIADPIRVYSLHVGVPAQAKPAVPAEPGAPEKPSPQLALPDKPSIAVLPFTNVSGEPDQQHFCDGVTDDLITDLSKVAGLFVIASHSSFAFKGRSADVRGIARELGVRYLLEGSARRAAGRIRINAQLIDARDGGHLWAERFDRSLDDIFAVQDEVTAKIVEALVGQLTPMPPARNRPANLEAYDLCVRSRFLLAGSPQTSREARVLLECAIALDPGYAEAHSWLAFNRWFAWIHWGEPMEPNRGLAVELAERATALDPNDAGARWILGSILVFERRWPEAEAAFDSALRLDPNHADAWAMMSNLAVYQGRPSEAVYQVERALRLNPHPPNWYFWALGQAQYAAGRYEEAVTTLRREETYRTGSRRILAASLAQLERLDEARHEAEMFLVSNPHFTLSQWRDTQPFRDETALHLFLEGYRKAGLPD